MSTSTAVTLLSSAARATTGSGAAVDLVEKTTAILYADLTAITGAGSLTLTVKTSPNGTSGWTTVSPANGSGGSLVFTAASSVGLQKVTFPGCERYIRVDWSISGGATMTFSVFGAAYLVFATPADLGLFAMRPEGWSNVSAVSADAALREATDRIVSALQAQEYLGPFTTWGDDTRGACCKTAAPVILTTRGWVPKDAADPIVNLAAQAEVWIDLVAKGQRKPFGVTDSTPTEHEGGVYIVTETARGW